MGFSDYYDVNSATEDIANINRKKRSNNMGGIFSAVISAIASIGGTFLGGHFQNKALEKGESQSRQIYLTELAESRATRKSTEKLTREKLRESKRQYNLSYELQKEELGLKEQKMASETFHQQASKLTQILGKNEQLKNLFHNRLSGLRRSA